jgi:Domain of unknown function (DUF1905)
MDPQAVRLAFSGELWYWRGPSPYHFVTVPDDGCALLKSIASEVTYGWGMIPVAGRIGATEFETALWPKDGRYVVPIRDVVRKGEGLSLGDRVEVELRIRSSGAPRGLPDDEAEYDMDRGPADV